jgi:hypothetical protein
MSSAAASTIVNGVKVEDAVTVRRLPLNSAGTRYKAVFRVYVAAFISKKKVTTADGNCVDRLKRLAATKT